MESYTQKSDFRKRAKEKLKKFQNKFFASKIVSKRLKLLLRNMKGRVLFYLPLDIEPDIRNVILWRMKIDGDVFVPRVVGDDFLITKLRFPIEKGRFTNEGSSKNGFFGKIDVAVIPVIGVDLSFSRIGFGKGMYDRYIRNLNTKPVVIFVQLDTLLNREIITNYFDIESEFYISSKLFLQILRNRRYGNNVNNYIHGIRKWSAFCANQKKRKKNTSGG
jgi:5-formyltetrahydrofolate cyclo-ligase